MRVDVAGIRALKQYVSGWEQLNQFQQSEVAAGLRVFLDTCPDGGNVKLEENIVESCCSTHDVVSVVCAESGDRLLEQRVY